MRSQESVNLAFICWSVQTTGNPLEVELPKMQPLTSGLRMKNVDQTNNERVFYDVPDLITQLKLVPDYKVMLALDGGMYNISRLHHALLDDCFAPEALLIITRRESEGLTVSEILTRLTNRKVIPLAVDHIDEIFYGLTNVRVNDIHQEVVIYGEPRTL